MARTFDRASRTASMRACQCRRIADACQTPAHTASCVRASRPEDLVLRPSRQISCLTGQQTRRCRPSPTKILRRTGSSTRPIDTPTMASCAVRITPAGIPPVPLGSRHDLGTRLGQSPAEASFFHSLTFTFIVQLKLQVRSIIRFGDSRDSPLTGTWVHRLKTLSWSLIVVGPFTKASCQGSVKSDLT